MADAGEMFSFDALFASSMICGRTQIVYLFIASRALRARANPHNLKLAAYRVETFAVQWPPAT